MARFHCDADLRAHHLPLREGHIEPLQQHNNDNFSLHHGKCRTHAAARPSSKRHVLVCMTRATVFGGAEKATRLKHERILPIVRVAVELAV